MTDKPLKTGFTHDSQKNISVDWYTPSWIFERMGVEFDLDPCQPKEKISWIPAKKHYWEEIDGLTQVWEGNVWCNPPYNKHTIDWLKKLSEHGNGIALVFARTDNRWFHNYVTKADAILFMKGRVKFVDGLGVTGNAGAGSGSMLIAYGQHNVKVLESMSDLGWLVKQQSVGAKPNE